MIKRVRGLIAFLLVFDLSLPSNILCANILELKAQCLAPRSSFPEKKPPSLSHEVLTQDSDFRQACHLIYELREAPPDFIRDALQREFKNRSTPLPFQIDLKSVLILDDSAYFLFASPREARNSFVALTGPGPTLDARLAPLRLRILARNDARGIAVISQRSAEAFLAANYRRLSLQEPALRRWLKRFRIPESELEVFVSIEDVRTQPVLGEDSLRGLDRGEPTAEQKSNLKAFILSLLGTTALFTLLSPNLSSRPVLIVFANFLLFCPILIFFGVKRISSTLARTSSITRPLWQRLKRRMVSFAGLFSLAALTYAVSRISTIFHEFGHWVVAGLEPWVISRQLTIVWENFLVGVGILAYVQTVADPSLYDPANPLHAFLLSLGWAAGGLFEFILGLTLLAVSHRLKDKKPRLSLLALVMSLPVFWQAISYPLLGSEILTGLTIPPPSFDWAAFTVLTGIHLWNVILFFLYVPMLVYALMTYGKPLRSWLRERANRIWSVFKKLLPLRWSSLDLVLRPWKMRRRDERSVFDALFGLQRQPNMPQIAWTPERLSEKIREVFPGRVRAEFVLNGTCYFALSKSGGDVSSQAEFFSFNTRHGLSTLREPQDAEAFRSAAKDYFHGISHLNAGGTIDMRIQEGSFGDGALNESGATRSSLISSSRKIFERGPDSSSFGPGEFHRIAQVVHTEIERKELLARLLGLNVREGGGIVVNHGTDTLAQTAFVLSQLFNARLSLPVVLTGSAQAPAHPDSDAVQNFRSALEAASSRQLPGLVYCVFQDAVFLGDRFHKNALDDRRTSGQNMMEPYEFKVGDFRGSTLHLTDNFLNWWKNQEHRLGRTPRIGLSESMARRDPPVLEFGYADHVLLPSYASPELIFDAVERARAWKRENGRNAAAILIEGKIQTNVHHVEIMKILESAAQDSILVAAADLPSKRNFLRIPPYMPAWQARTLISIITGTFLKKEMSVRKAAKILRQEFWNFTSQRRSKHVQEDAFITEADAGMVLKAEWIKIYPGMSAQVIMDAARRAQKDGKKLIFMEGLGNGHAGIGTAGAADRVRDYLARLKPGKTSAEAALIGELEALIRPDASLNEVVTLAARFLANLSDESLSAFELSRGGDEAVQLVRSAIVSSHPVLAALHDAHQKGLSVIAYSDAARGSVNLNRYETGKLMKMAGVTDLRAFPHLQGRFLLTQSAGWSWDHLPKRMPRVLVSGPAHLMAGPAVSRAAEDLGIPLIDLESLIRNVARDDEEWARLLQKGVREDAATAMDFVLSALQMRLLQPDVRDGFILSGFPRGGSLPAQLDQMLSRTGIKLDGVILLYEPGTSAADFGERYESRGRTTQIALPAGRRSPRILKNALIQTIRRMANSPGILTGRPALQTGREGVERVEQAA